MDFQKLFSEYWSQVTLLLLAISYFIKRIFDNKSKRIEINHSLFQQNRLTAVNSYFKSLARTELMWRQLQIWNILDNKLNAVELDNIIWPPLNELKQSVLELKIYFNNDTHKYFEQMLEKYISINSELSKLYFWTGPEMTIVQKVNRFETFKEKAIKENNETLSILCDEIRKMFQ